MKEQIISKKPSNTPEINICITSKGNCIERFNAALVKQTAQDKLSYCAVFIDKSAKIMHFQFTNEGGDLTYKVSKNTSSIASLITASLKETGIKPGKYNATQSKEDKSTWFIKY